MSFKPGFEKVAIYGLAGKAIGGAANLIGKGLVRAGKGAVRLGGGGVAGAANAALTLGAAAGDYSDISAKLRRAQLRG